MTDAVLEPARAGTLRVYGAAMFVAGLAYLGFELWFNLRLVEIAGDKAALDELHTIETIGRILSGVGLALTLLKTQWIKKFLPALDPLADAHRNMRLLALAGVVVASIVAMVTIQKSILSSIADGYTAEERQRAAALVAVARATAEERIELVGVEGMNRSELLTYRALLPFLQDGVTAGEAARQNEIAIRIEIERQMRIDTPEAKRRLYAEFVAGSQELGSRYREYQGGQDRLPAAQVEIRNRAYAQYVEATNKFYANETALEPLQNQKWAEYRQALNEKRVAYPIADPRVCKRVRDEVLKKLPTIPLDWDCRNRDRFDTAVEEIFQRDMNAKWQAEIRKAGIVGVPPGLSRDEFFRNESVRRKIAAENAKVENQVRQETRKGAGFELPMGLSYPAFVAHPSVAATIEKRSPEAWRLFVAAGYKGFPLDIPNAEAFERKIIRPAFENALKSDSATNARIQAGLAPAESYGPDGENAAIGRRAVDAMVGPPIALFCSLLFFILNLRSLLAPVLSGLMGMISPRLGVVGSLASIGIVAGLLAAPLSMRNQVVENANFQTRLAQKESLARGAIFWLAHAEPLIHGMFNREAELRFAEPVQVRGLKN
jgi:hypothetical protein